jgi:hypothetical protein
MKLVLAGNMLAGDSVPKRQIPRFYKEMFGLNNLFRLFTSGRASFNVHARS